jgi:hypothetical protein
MSLRIFVATRAEDVPPEAVPFLSVDGSVPGALHTWDHHVTGEAVNLDAMPDHVDTAGIRGVGTTLADTDALASVVAVLVGGPARLPADVREALYAASHRCDQIVRAPGVSDAADAVGAGLHRYVMHALVGTGVRSSEVFARLCEEVLACVVEGRPLPTTPPDPSHAAAIAALRQAGRVRVEGDVALFDLRHRPTLPVEELHRAHDRRLAVIVHEHPAGGPQYSVGVNPFHPDPLPDVRPALAALAQAEYAHGPPCRSPEPVPGAENWGGRKTVFGSPWNYGSRLGLAEVMGICRAALDG